MILWLPPSGGRSDALPAGLPPEGGSHTLRCDYANALTMIAQTNRNATRRSALLEKSHSNMVSFRPFY
jgi:hypothetical protein